MKKSNLITVLVTSISLSLLTSAAFAEDALFIDQSGSVGIGTTSPGYSLVVNGSGSDRIVLEDNGDARATLGHSDSNGGFIILNDDNNNEDVFIRTYGDTYFNGGNVGIGTTSPGEKLDVRTGHIRAGGAEGTTARLKLYDNTEIKRIELDADGITYFNGGNVGIGTTSPSYKLHVNGNLYADTLYTDSNTYADFVFEKGYSLESIEDHSNFMWANKHLPALKGNSKTGEKTNIVERLENAIEELEKAHIYVEQLHRQNKKLEKRLTRLETILQKQNK